MCCARHILVAGLPALLADIVVEALSGKPGVELVEVVHEPLDSTGRIADDVTLLILPDGLERGTAAMKVLAGRPDIGVLAIAGDARRAALIELWPRRRDLGELSPQSLYRALRTTTLWADRFRDSAPTITHEGLR